MTEILVDIGDIDVPEGTIKCVYREIRIDEKVLFVGGNGEQVLYCNGACPPRGKRIVFEQEPPWEWPEFIKEGWWIAMDKCGEWAVYDSEPMTDDKNKMWGPDVVGIGHWKCGDLGLFNWTPPPCTDWKQSKRQKPVKEGEAAK